MIPKFRTLIPIVLVLVFSSTLFLYQLGSRSLANWDEAWYADASRYMFHNRHYLTPVWNGQYFFDKPPLQYWLTQPFLYIFGEKETSYRLLSALSCIGLTILTFIWGKKRFGIPGGLAASAVLLSFPHFIDRGRSGNFDGLFIFLTTLSLYLFISKKTIWGGVSLGLAWMTKGIFSGFFPIITIGLFSIYEIIRDKKFTLLKSLFIFTASAAFIYFPWYFFEVNRFEDLISKSYFATLDQGTFGKMSWMDVAWRFDLRYLVFLWTFLRLWFPILIIAVIVKILQLNKDLITLHISSNQPQSAHLSFRNSASQNIRNLYEYLYKFPLASLSRSGPVAGMTKTITLESYLPLLVFIIIFIALSAAREKNDWYIMPVYPFAAILISEFIFSLFRTNPIFSSDTTTRGRKPREWRAYYWGPFLFVVIFSITNICLYRRQAFPLDNHLPEKQVAQMVKDLTTPQDLIVTAEYEFPGLIYYSERQVRTAARQSDYEGKYWWIWNNIDIEKALKKGQSIVTIHRPGTEWSIDVYGWHREKIGELNGRIISRLVPD